MPKFVTLLAFLVPMAASAATTSAQVRELTSRFHETMVVCPDRIWADFSWKDLRVFLSYPSRETSFIWDVSTNSIQEVRNESLSPSVLTSTFSFFESEGRKALSLNMEEGAYDYFTLGIHEFFHYHGQDGWIRATSGRGTDYPLSWEPRFYRRMIFDNLRDYFEFEREENLRKARYWYEKWVRSSPSESKVTTDGYEGTARYVETLAKLLDKQGCGAKDADLKKAALAYIKANFGSAVSGWFFALDSEGYEIGGLAALILRFGAYDLKEWNARMKKGETPLEVLLENVRPLEEPEPWELRSTFRMHANSQNKRYGDLIGKDISNWSDRTFVRVSFPSQFVHSTYSPVFFARSVELDKLLMPLALEFHLYSSSGRSDLRLKTNAVVFMGDPSNICSNNFGYTLVPRSELRFVSGQEAMVETPSVVGKLVGEIKTDEAGFEYFCAE